MFHGNSFGFIGKIFVIINKIGGLNLYSFYKYLAEYKKLLTIWHLDGSFLLTCHETFHNKKAHLFTSINH